MTALLFYTLDSTISHLCLLTLAPILWRRPQGSFIPIFLISGWMTFTFLIWQNFLGSYYKSSSHLWICRALHAALSIVSLVVIRIQDIPDISRYKNWMNWRKEAYIHSLATDDYELQKLLIENLCFCLYFLRVEGNSFLDDKIAIRQNR